jgi:hypothetical protein
MTNDVGAGWMNKLRSAMANITPAGILAEAQRKVTKRGSGSSTEHAASVPSQGTQR